MRNHIFRPLAQTVLVAATLLAGLLPGAARTEMRLLMFEQPGCAYCAEWDRVIAPIYPKTAEGAAAPLQRVQLRGPYPEDMTLGPNPVFTPTFVLVQDGIEAGRIEGYPGEDFFWGLLGQMLRQSGEFDPATGVAGGG